MREYTDTAGVRWKVWMVQPGSITGRMGEMVGGVIREPWLCFESRDEKWRLAPVPSSWQARSDTDLDSMRRAGVRVPHRQ
jgi:hypothetical protein